MALGDPFLFEPRRFWGDEDVKLLDWLQVGVYMRLLSCQWEEGDIPKDGRRLHAVLAGGLRSGVDEEDLAVVLEFFPVIEGAPDRRRHPKHHEDREAWIAKKAAFKESKAAAGRASGAARRARVQHLSNTCSTDVEQKTNTARTKTNSSSLSLSSSLSVSKEEKPPLTPPGERKRKDCTCDPAFGVDDRCPKHGAQAKRGRGKAKAKPKTPGGRVLPAVTIPPELLAIGIDAASFAEAIDCRKAKKRETWQKELDALAPMVAECGVAAVLDTWQSATIGGWQGCTPAFVRDEASKASKRGNGQGRRPSPVQELNDAIMNQPPPPDDDTDERLERLAAALPDNLDTLAGLIRKLKGREVEAIETGLAKLDARLVAKELPAEAAEPMAQRLIELRQSAARVSEDHRVGWLEENVAELRRATHGVGYELSLYAEPREVER